MYKINKKNIILTLVLIVIGLTANAQESLRNEFLNSRSVICGINIRNFNAQDINKNGIIDPDEQGNFLNAIDKLDELKDAHVSAIHLLPITPTGKLKALGNAGSLYAISDFSTINSQLTDLTSDIKPKEQAKMFIAECHKRGIKVIVDLPSCGSYDFFLNRPELFLKDRKKMSIVPSDWTDVRLFNAGNNKGINDDLLNEHKKFVDMVISLNADGIRADVATIKPYEFWTELIKYTRKTNPEFLFLAEASDSWREPPSKYAPFTPYNQLLEAGFDGYYGSFFNLKEWSTAQELINHVKFNKKLLNSYSENKNVILSFTTHDVLSPMLIHKENYSVMLCWLYATLPFNPYFIDGFSTGATYEYDWANQKANYSETDDDYYFVHHGQFDIFNFSQKPVGDSKIVQQNFKSAMDFRYNNAELISKGTFTPLKTDKESVYAYTRSYKGNIILVIGNLDFNKAYKNCRLKVSDLNNNATIENINNDDIILTNKNNVIYDIDKGEIKVFKINKQY